MAWIYLAIAGLFEVAWAIGLKYTMGFTRVVPSVLTIAGMVISFGFLSLALRTLPLGTAYAVWTGIGAAGTVLVGMLMFGEPVEPLRLGCLVLIISGVAGLKLLSPQ
jgi:quaternary ammonium compound-resistance protein SugE